MTLPRKSPCSPYLRRPVRTLREACLEMAAKHGTVPRRTPCALKEVSAKQQAAARIMANLPAVPNRNLQPYYPALPRPCAPRLAISGPAPSRSERAPMK